MSKQHLLEKEDNNKLQIVGMEKRLYLLGNHLFINMPQSLLCFRRTKKGNVYFIDLFLRIARRPIMRMIFFFKQTIE